CYVLPALVTCSASPHDALPISGLCGRILLPGYQERMTDWLSALTVLVLSSRTEGTPMVLLEAMQLGTPIATFAVGGIPDVLVHRSEEHTSELQSRFDLVCRLLL